METLNEQILNRGNSTSSRNSQWRTRKKIEEINKEMDLIEIELNEFKADLTCY